MSRLDDIVAIRAEFPQLSRLIHGKPLVYFDNANTAQKPRAVIDAVSSYFTEHNGNVARADASADRGKLHLAQNTERQSGFCNLINSVFLLYERLCRSRFVKIRFARKHIDLHYVKRRH